MTRAVVAVMRSVAPVAAVIVPITMVAVAMPAAVMPATVWCMLSFSGGPRLTGSVLTVL